VSTEPGAGQSDLQSKVKAVIDALSEAEKTSNGKLKIQESFGMKRNRPLRRWGSTTLSQLFVRSVYFQRRA
jgi:hypothetical protein